jgi:hypothetical protein
MNITMGEATMLENTHRTKPNQLIVSRFSVAEIEANHRNGDRNRCKQPRKKQTAQKEKTENSRCSLDWSGVEDIDEGRRTHTMRMRPRVQRNVNTLKL